MKRLLLVKRILTILPVLLAVAVIVLIVRVRKEESLEAYHQTIKTDSYEIAFPDDPETILIWYRIDRDKFLSEVPPEKEKYFAFARYLEAQLYYEAYAAAGMEEEAAHYAAIMNETEWSREEQ